jgi:tetratricopeptide (TPR) repeat protein
MSVLKQILVFIILIFFGAVCAAQREKIDSLKKALLTSKDTQRINCLNALSKAYLFSSPGAQYFYIQRDSSLLYSNKAFSEAETTHYVQGMADAMFNKGKYKQDLQEKKQDYLSAISFYQQCNNTDTLGQVYFSLGEVLRKEANFNGSIEVYKKAIQLYTKAQDSFNRGVTLTFIGLAYGASGDYEKAFDYSYEALQVREKNKQQDPTGALWSLSNLGRLFQEVEDYPTAIEYYYTKCADYAKTNGVSWGIFYDKIAECYWRMHQPDSPFYYMRKYMLGGLNDTTAFKKRLQDTAETDFHIGQIHLVKNQYDQALKIFLINMKNFESRNERGDLMETIDYIGEAYLGKGDYENALIYAQKLLDLAQKTWARQYIRDGTKHLWQAYDHMKSVDSAYKYYRKYIGMRDSVSSYSFISQMTSFKETVAKEKRELQYSQELEKQSFIRKILIGSILLFAFLAVIIFRNVLLKRKNEKLEKEGLQNELNVQQLESDKKQTALHNKAIELEMQALRAQMNPHFIFNSLNSINRFILQNNRLQASEYLTKFSKLVRMILQNSQCSLISLESELESLGLYLEMEALRFNYHFAYKISVPKDLDVEMLKVPPLILQPYVENAIWHGLMHKEEKGQLDIEVSEEGDHLYFKITDNGIGRKKASEIASKSATKHKSMGLRITANRIAMIQHSNDEESPVKINDLVHDDGTAAGTEVVIKMPVIEEM